MNQKGKRIAGDAELENGKTVSGKFGVDEQGFEVIPLLDFQPRE